MKVVDNDARAQKPARKKPGRAPVSCAECRRLKMKCDRGNPCENCTKRGCAAICPDGTLTTGKHNRMILSNTEELHDKIESLLDRIRLLEDALKALQASVSTEQHPLLAVPTTESVLSTIHITQTQHDNPTHPTLTQEEDGDALDSFGTLSIGSDGETSYLGQTARADYLINESDSDDEPDVGRLPRSFYNFCWPECPPPDNSIEDTVLSFLPDLNEAYALCDIYCSLSSWMGFLVPRESIREDFIAHVYHLPNRPWADTLPTCPHRLALLFSIFSLGALFDPAQEPNNVQSDDYYHLARVALSFKSAVLETTVHAVLAIVHMAYILLLRDSSSGHEQGWVMLGVANKLAVGMGLHRDSSKWHLSEELSESRHTTFWQLYLMETMASFHFGRPALLSDSFIDCPLPKHLAPMQRPSRNETSTYLAWLIQFAQLARQTLSQALGAKALSYNSVLEIDVNIRKLADLDWNSPEYVEDDQDHSTLEKIRWSVSHCKETILLHIHRGFLVEAFNENPQNPSLSKYGRSVQACFESSYRLIESVAWVAEQCPQISSRMSSLFNASISSAVIMCIIVTRCTTSDMARPAMEKLESVHSTLQRYCKVNRTARKNLLVTRRLRNLARAAFDKTRADAHGTTILFDDISMLNRCCGKTYVRTRKERNIEHTKRSRGRKVHSSENLDQETGANLGERSVRTPWSIASQGSASSCGDELTRLGLSGDSFNAPFGQGLDSTWNIFIQQLGF